MPASPHTSNRQILEESKEKDLTSDFSTGIIISPEKEYVTHEVGRKSYQYRALGRKTVSYQKRQWFVNICCLSICPFMMVAIGGILGLVVTDLIRKNAPVARDYLTCSATNASDIFGFPSSIDELISENRNKNIYTSPRWHPYDLNFLLTSSGFTTPSDISSDNLQSCVFWFEHDYPYRLPYEPDPGVGSLRRKDTTFKPDPVGGWFGPSILQKPQAILSMQTLPWAFVLDRSGVDSGRRELQPLDVNISDIGNIFQNGSGILGSMPTDYFLDFSTIRGIPARVPQNAQEVLKMYQDRELPQIQGTPYFEKIIGTTNDVDTEILSRILNVTRTLGSIESIPDSISTLPSYYKGLVDVYRELPWGSILFDEVNPGGLKWDYTLQIGASQRINKIVKTYPKRGLRNVALQTKLSTAFLKSTPNGADAKISHGFRAMPQVVSTKINLPIGSLIGGILYPFGISFLIPIFVIILVKEKEDRILVMMRMNGLSARAYYITHYIHFYVLYVISSIVFVLTGIGFRMTIFTETHPLVYIVLLFMWGHAQIAIAFLLSSFFSKTRTALVTTFLIILCGVICNLGFELIFNGNTPAAYYLWLPLAFYHGLHVINTASIEPLSRPYSLANMLYPGDLARSLIALGVGTIAYLLIAFYLIEVLPSDYGVRKPWYFIFTHLFKGCSKERKSGNDLPFTSGTEDQQLIFEDDDVRAERQKVLNDQYDHRSPLVMKNMRKVYSSNKVAVKNVTFSVEPNMVFGLLGPNGAGKSTLISILTGLYEPTSGQAYLGGFNVETEMKQVYMSTGVCPQHDILWEDLTVGEHLLYYARLKGVSPSEEKARVEKALAGVSLQKFKNRLSKGLSGGEKRRLSIAIALIGSPKVVFLDEPTTGLDPEVKRLIWDIISDAKHGRTVVLTTHSMEEAEVLCSRIGIMAHGTLRCIGTQLRLKEVYGNGFKLAYNCDAGMSTQASGFIESLLPSGWKKIDSFVTSTSYEFVPVSGYIPVLFEKIEAHKHQYGIIDWGLSQTSLEEVFLKIIQDADANAE